MRRTGKRGVAGIRQRKRAQQQQQKIGNQLQTAKLGEMKLSFEKFQSELQKFAAKHKKNINRDPQFRSQFNSMCMRIGVDPLASSKGFWGDLLGIGDFYYELSIQIIEVCLQSRKINGGLIEINELLEKIRHKRKKNAQEISVDDLKCAIGKVKSLGNGFGIINIGSREMVKSVPIELNTDHSLILSNCHQTGCTTITQLKRKCGWTQDRVEDSLRLMMNEGMAWIDTQSGSEAVYWFPSLFNPRK